MNKETDKQKLAENIAGLAYTVVKNTDKQEILENARNYLDSVVATYYNGKTSSTHESAIRYLVLHELTDKYEITPQHLLLEMDHIKNSNNDSVETTLYRIAKETAKSLNEKKLLDDEASLKLLAYATSESIKTILRSCGEGVTKKALELMALSKHEVCDLEAIESTIAEINDIIRKVEEKYHTRIDEECPPLRMKLISECIRAIDDKIKDSVD